jgi:homogentisate 1,2-dioxygenase
MIRPWLQISRGKTPRQAHVGLDGLKDDELGRGGFTGRVANLYRRNDPTAWTRIEGEIRLWDIALHAIEPTDMSDPAGAPMLAFFNDDVRISVSRRAAPMPFFVRNGDADELHFIHRGTGRFETEFGPLEYGPGDYVKIPKATTYRVVPETTDQYSLVIATFGEIDFPDYGPLGRHAPFDPTVIRIPDPTRYESPVGPEWEVRLTLRGKTARIFYPFHPLDVEGFKGDLFPFAMNLADFRPVMSDRLHLPPSVHCNFEARGVQIINFLPRPLETEAGAERMPWYHRNVDYDELVFTHGGDFLGQPLKKGRCSLSPQGLHHGLPEAVREYSRKTAKPGDRIGWELVSVDCANPLVPTAEAAALDRSARAKDSK